MLYLSVTSIDCWAAAHTVREGQRLYKAGCVLGYDVDGSLVSGTVQLGGRRMLTRFEIQSDGTVDSSRCPCRDCRERGVTCANVVAVGLAFLNSIKDPRRDRRIRIDQRKEERKPDEWKNYIQRVDADQPGAIPATLRIKINKTWQKEVEDDAVQIHLSAEYKQTKAKLDKVSKTLPLTWDAEDAYLLDVLEDCQDGQPLGGSIRLTQVLFADLLQELSHHGLPIAGSKAVLGISMESLTPHIMLELNKKTGELILRHGTSDSKLVNEFFVIGDEEGWMFCGDNFHPLGQTVPETLRGLYNDHVVIPRKRVLHFMENELPLIEKSMEVATKVTSSDFERILGEPAMRLVIAGDPERASLVLYADYEGVPGPRAGVDFIDSLFAAPHSKKKLGYYVRNLEVENEALDWLHDHGCHITPQKTIEPVDGTRAVMNFIGRDVPLIQRKGWKVEFDEGFSDLTNRAEWVHPVVDIQKAKQPGWFDVSYHYEDENGKEVSDSWVEQALVENRSCFEEDNRLFLLDMAAIDSVHDVFDDCSVKEPRSCGGVRLGDIHAGYSMSSLQLIDGVKIQCDEAWKRRVAEQNRHIELEKVPISKGLQGVLRPYQKEGVFWLRYLENCGFAGILADEMGLGKTVQTLAWLEMKRTSESANCGPALIVCPTSLVENWADEAIKFTPNLKLMCFTGPHRKKSVEDFDKMDVIVTSYALLRRDIQMYEERRFSVAVLDEAQHIKNHSTQNAKAAKRVKSAHRVVLTGTPIENSITDLWSIMDFLMPKYLGNHRQFRESYEIPLQTHGPNADRVQQRLKRKVHPFMLRRLKIDVVKELPPKIEKIASCVMTSDQRRAYEQLLSNSRNQVYGLVADKGFKQARFEIFKTLTRLRQACCHLELLKMPNIKADQPSGKLDLFHELLDEAIDGGNRILVFSQFVAMLKILRRELDKRKIQYCYLDGSTRERMKEVRRFNNTPEIPAFLISLKAGGTGLNLTGADTVIHYDPWWNPAVEDQATDRAHRIGQERTVYSLKLITKDSVEEKVLALQRRKKSIINATLSTDEQVMEKLSWEDVQELLAT
jgi:superfamily II DNA or RNA helicase